MKLLIESSDGQGQLVIAGPSQKACIALTYSWLLRASDPQEILPPPTLPDLGSWIAAHLNGATITWMHA